MERIVIVGAGQAGLQTAASLRSSKFEGQISLIGEEPYSPYQRPPLSKTFLKGEMSFDKLLLKPEDFYDKMKINLLLDRRVESIDRGRKSVALADGETISYGKLVLATGARVRKIEADSEALADLHYLRTLDDTLRIQEACKTAQSVAIIGGGYIGLEAAASLRQLGKSVTVVEREPQILARVAAKQTSDYFTRLHASHGVEILTGTEVDSVMVEDDANRIRLKNGQVIEADIVIVGIGVMPNCEIAEAAGLKTENGIVVDELCRTSDPDILAIGDCSNHPNGIYGGRLRLESVHNAVEQAKTAAGTILGSPKPYSQVPWFWSDQYDVKLQIAGLNTGYDEVAVREDNSGAYSVFYLKDGVVVAVDAMNAAASYLVGRRLIGEKKHADPKMLSNPNMNLKEMIR